MKTERKTFNAERDLPQPQRLAVTFGVMGGASPVRSREHLAQAHELGQAIAGSGCVLITGACPGLPHAAACGARQAGGTVIGISPAMNLDEHVHKYRSPVEPHDVLIFTGSGLMGREVINIRSSDVVVIVGGRSGTLGELAIAYDEGKLIGVLTGMGGIADITPDILAVCAKDTGAEVIYDTDPRKLVAELLRILRSRKSPSRTCSEAGQPADETGKPAASLTADPVCGMTFAPCAAATRRTRSGKRYYFCSLSCAEEFDASPDRYVPPAQRRIVRPKTIRERK